MSNPIDASDQLALVTCSYQPDFERCARLCASLDVMVDPQVPHFIVTPERDKRSFARLAAKNRTIISTEEVMPAGFMQLPLINKWWLDSAMWPVRGWMMQQLTKLSADVITRHENIIFVDSDIEFLRPLQNDRFLSNGALRLHRKPMEKNDGIHLKWHHAAGELLGLHPRYFGSDYIAPLATWKRSNLIKLKHFMEGHVARPWYEAVGRRVTVSEYTLYGVFVEHVLGMRESGHFGSAEDMCHCLWFEHETESFLRDYCGSKLPQAVLLQSNIGLAQDDVELLMCRVRQQLAVSQ